MRKKFNKSVEHFYNKLLDDPIENLPKPCNEPILKDAQLLSIKCPEFGQMNIPILNKRGYDIFNCVGFSSFVSMMRSNLGRYDRPALCRINRLDMCTQYVVGNNFLFDRSNQKLLYVTGTGKIYVDSEVWRNNDNPDYKFLKTKLILPTLEYSQSDITLEITDTERFWRVDKDFLCPNSIGFIIDSLIWELSAEEKLLQKLREKYEGKQENQECDEPGDLRDKAQE